jgi:hypothetical protein
LTNFVQAIPDFSTLAEPELVGMLLSDPNTRVSRVKTRDGAPLPEGVPPFIASPVEFDEKKLDLQDLQVRLIDFGEGKISSCSPIGSRSCHQLTLSDSVHDIYQTRRAHTFPKYPSRTH